jgi:hypothetical protein
MSGRLGPVGDDTLGGSGVDLGDDAMFVELATGVLAGEGRTTALGSDSPLSRV